MAFYSSEEVQRLGFKAIGKNVKISKSSSLYNLDQIEIGDNSRIDDFCVLSGKIQIKRNVHIAVFCNIAGGEKGIVMDDYSGMAYGVNIFSQSDDYSGMTMTNPTVPEDYKNEIKKEVYIGKYAIIGTGSIVTPGVFLAEGTAVGAMTLITRSTKAWSIYVGNPARLIKQRDKKLLDLAADYEKVYG